MSKIALTPNPSGTGTLTVAAPNTNTDRTLTLPDVTTTLVGTDASQTLTNKSIAASQLTGALPAIDGSALTGIVTGGMTLLGTLTTTSGSTVTLSGLTLTSYKQLTIVVNGVSPSTTASIRTNGNDITGSTVASYRQWGIGNIYFGTIFGMHTYGEITIASDPNIVSAVTNTFVHGLTTSSTSISFSVSAGTFDAGSILIYGVK